MMLFRMSLTSDFTSDEDELCSDESEELDIWPTHSRRAPLINFRPEVVVDKGNWQEIIKKNG
jgi:hypothetical protein